MLYVTPLNIPREFQFVQVFIQKMSVHRKLAVFRCFFIVFCFKSLSFELNRNSLKCKIPSAQHFSLENWAVRQIWCTFIGIFSVNVYTWKEQRDKQRNFWRFSEFKNLNSNDYKIMFSGLIFIKFQMIRGTKYRAVSLFVIHHQSVMWLLLTETKRKRNLIILK